MRVGVGISDLHKRWRADLSLTMQIKSNLPKNQFPTQPSDKEIYYE